MDTVPVNYNTYYSLFMQSGVNLYLSWSSLKYWAYLYETPKALWFDRASGTNSGQVQTGDSLRIVCHLFGPGFDAYLQSNGVNETAQWTQVSSACNWTIWQGTEKVKGQLINLNDTVFFESQAYPGNDLVQYKPSYPTYLSTGATTVPYQFQILDQDGLSTPRVAQPPPPSATKA